MAPYNPVYDEKTGLAVVQEEHLAAVVVGMKVSGKEYHEKQELLLHEGFALLVGAGGSGKSTALRELVSCTKLCQGHIELHFRLSNQASVDYFVTTTTLHLAAVALQKYARGYALNVSTDYTLGEQYSEYPAAKFDQMLREAKRAVEAANFGPMTTFVYTTGTTTTVRLAASEQLSVQPESTQELYKLGGDRAVRPGSHEPWYRDCIMPIARRLFSGTPADSADRVLFLLQRSLAVLPQHMGALMKDSAKPYVTASTVEGIIHDMAVLEQLTASQAFSDLKGQMDTLFHCHLAVTASSESYLKAAATSRNATEELAKRIQNFAEEKYPGDFAKKASAASLCAWLYNYHLTGRSDSPEPSPDGHLLHQMHEEAHFGGDVHVRFRELQEAAYSGTLLRESDAPQVRFSVRGSDRQVSLEELPGSVCSGLLSLTALYCKEQGTVLLDEPTANFDQRQRTLFRTLLRARVKPGLLHCIVVTHAQDLVGAVDSQSLVHFRATPERKTVMTCNPLKGLSEATFDYRFKGMLFHSAVLVVEGRDDKRVCRAAQKLLADCEEAREAARAHGIDCDSILHCAIIQADGKSTVVPTACKRLGIPVGVLYDGDGIKDAKSLCKKFNWEAPTSGDNRCLFVLSDESGGGGVFLWKGEMEEMFEGTPAATTLYRAANAKRVADAKGRLVLNPTTDQLSVFLCDKNTWSLHGNWAVISTSTIHEVLKEHFLGTDGQFMTFMKWWSDFIVASHRH